MRPPSPAVRRWVYGVACATGPLLIAYGLLTEQTATLWLALVGAVLVPGLALVNTPDDPAPRRGRDDDGDGNPDVA